MSFRVEPAPLLEGLLQEAPPASGGCAQGAGRTARACQWVPSGSAVDVALPGMARFSGRQSRQGLGVAAAAAAGGRGVAAGPGAGLPQHDHACLVICIVAPGSRVTGVVGSQSL